MQLNDCLVGDSAAIACLNIAIVGAGQVGTINAACLLRQGHKITIVEKDTTRFEILTSKNSTSLTALESELRTAFVDGRLRAAADPANFLNDIDLVYICVGTPLSADGRYDTTQLLEAIQLVGAGLINGTRCSAPLLCVFRSTISVGTTRDIIIPALEAATGQAPGTTYDVVYYPEFLRAASGIEDYFNPSRIVIGEREVGCASQLWNVYRDIDAPRFAVSYELAELIKSMDNSFHALKVAFANEMGRISLSCNLDVEKLFEMFLADQKLNISTAYLRPGGAFGGPCLSKDLEALRLFAENNGVNTPLLQGIGASNSDHADFIIQRLVSSVKPKARILIVGLTYSAGTNDCRDSPLAKLSLQLHEKEYDVRIYDFDLPSGLQAQNLHHVRTYTPEIENMLFANVEEALADVDLIVIGKSLKNHNELLERLKESKIPLFDLNSFALLL